MVAQQPFRVDGDRAYGLGIGDNKHGVALIIHTLTALKALNFDGYGLVTVLISPDEEIGSVAERDLIAQLGAEHDLVLSCDTRGAQIRYTTNGSEPALTTGVPYLGLLRVTGNSIIRAAAFRTNRLR